MESNFINLLISGSLKDPILWILSLVIASNILSNSFKMKLFYLSVAGIIWGYIRLYIYKSFGQLFSLEQTLLLLFICFMLMILSGSFFYFAIKYFKSNS